MAGRSSALRGQEIVLTAIFTDAGNNFIDPSPSSSLKISIYPPNYDPRLGAGSESAWVAEASLTSIGSGAYASSLITRIATGQYEYTFSIPSDATLGTAFDNWTGTVDGQDLDETFTFVVSGGGAIGTAQLHENNVVLIELKSTIAASDGSLLNQDYRWHFTTTYNPLYTSARKVRLDLGPLVKEVSDDTINLAIFEASLEANALIFGTLQPSNWNYFYFARRGYVTCLAEMILLGSIMGSGGGAKSKKLADLNVNYSDNIDGIMNKVLSCIGKYEPVLTSAGQLAPGTSLQANYVVKGIDDPDRPVIGRGWEPTSTYMGADVQMPAANTKSRYTWKRRSQRDFAWPGRWNGVWRR